MSKMTLEDKKRYLREYRETHREEIREKNKIYRLKRLDKIHAREKTYRKRIKKEKIAAGISFRPRTDINTYINLLREEIGRSPLNLQNAFEKVAQKIGVHSKSVEKIWYKKISRLPGIMVTCGSSMEFSHNCKNLRRDSNGEIPMHAHGNTYWLFQQIMQLPDHKMKKIVEIIKNE